MLRAVWSEWPGGPRRRRSARAGCCRRCAGCGVAATAGGGPAAVRAAVRAGQVEDVRPEQLQLQRGDLDGAGGGRGDRDLLVDGARHQRLQCVCHGGQQRLLELVEDRRRHLGLQRGQRAVFSGSRAPPRDAVKVSSRPVMMPLTSCCGEPTSRLEFGRRAERHRHVDHLVAEVDDEVDARHVAVAGRAQRRRRRRALRLDGADLDAEGELLGDRGECRLERVVERGDELVHRSALRAGPGGPRVGTARRRRRGRCRC